MSVSSYPLVEKWKWIWIWLGDPAKADEGLIPDHDWLLLSDESLITTPFFTVELGCNIQIFHDNLLDASHLSYVHLGSFDNGGIAAAPYKIEEAGQSILLRREEPGVCYEETMAYVLGWDAGKKKELLHPTQTTI